MRASLASTDKSTEMPAILVVDENPEILSLISDLLKKTINCQSC